MRESAQVFSTINMGLVVLDRGEVVEQRLGGALQHCKDLVEAVGPAVPRVGHIVFAGVGIEVAGQQQPFVGEGSELGHKASVGAIHGDDEVEPPQVFDREWPRPLMADRDGRARGNLGASRIGWFTPVESRGSSAVKVEGA